MAVDTQQVLDLLGCGLSAEVVATAVGCDASYISQLMADDTFRAQVAEKRSDALQANSKRDRQIDALEDRVLAKISDTLDMLYKPNDLLRAFQVLNKAERRGIQAQESTVINQQIVNLQIPTQVTKSFTMNEHSEVIEIEGQTLVSMPAHQLLKKLQEESPDNERYKKIANYLPTNDAAVFTEARKKLGHEWGKKDAAEVSKSIAAQHGED